MRCDPTKFPLFPGQAPVCSLSFLWSPGDFGTIPGNVKTPLAALEAFLLVPGFVESQSVFQEALCANAQGSSCISCFPERPAGGGLPCSRVISLKPDFSAPDAALAFCHKGLDFHRAGGWAQLSCQLSLGLGGCPATAGGPKVVRDAGSDSSNSGDAFIHPIIYLAEHGLV